MNQTQIQKAYDYCESVTKIHAKSFYFAARFLPKAKRRAVYPIYAFCRHVDDEIDEIGEGSDVAAAEAVERWRRRLEETYVGKDKTGFQAGYTKPKIESRKSEIRNPNPPNADLTNQDLVLLAWEDLLKNYSIPIEIPLDAIKGVLMDTTVKRYSTFEELYVYCYRVASTVGLMSSEILGYSDRQALRYAEALGIGMQLTNILRDVSEDARRGRIYLPLEDLERFNVSEAQIDNSNFDDNFRRLMNFQIERARKFYAEGEKGIPLLEKDARFTVLLASRVYAKILDEIEKLDCDVFRRRAHTTKSQKLISLPGIWLQAKRLGAAS